MNFKKLYVLLCLLLIAKVHSGQQTHIDFGEAIIDFDFQKPNMSIQTKEGYYHKIGNEWILNKEYSKKSICTSFGDNNDFNAVEQNISGDIFIGIRNQLFRTCEQTEALAKFNSAITSISGLNSDELYISTRSNGIYIFKNGLARKLFIEGINVPNHVKKLRFLENELLYCDGLKVISINLINHISTTLYASKFGQVNFELDGFNQIHISDGTRYLLNDSRLDLSDLAIQLDLIEGEFINSNYFTTNESGLFIAQINRDNTEHLEGLNYFINEQGRWNKIENGLLRIQLESEGKELMISGIKNNNRSKTQLIQLKRAKVESINYWPYILSAFAGLMFAFAILLYRDKSIRSNYDQKIARIRSENKLLRSEQQILQMEMNPHFLFNSINSIKGLIASNRNKEARLYLSKFASMMRSLLNYSREKTILLSEEIQFLEDYLLLEQMSRPNSFDYNIDKDSSILDTEEIPGMMIQPFLENAIIHGIKPKAEKGFINIEFKKINGQLSCRITDDGVGRTNITEQKTYKSYSTEIISERISKKNSSNKLEIIDLKSESGQPLGTQVIIPL